MATKEKGESKEKGGSKLRKSIHQKFLKTSKSLLNMVGKEGIKKVSKDVEEQAKVPPFFTKIKV